MSDVERFYGVDPSAELRKRPGQFGTLSLGLNYPESSNNKEIFFGVDDCLTTKFAMLTMSPEAAMDVLVHLNSLLGNPLSHPATAGGFAPSAD